MTRKNTKYLQTAKKHHSPTRGGSGALGEHSRSRAGVRQLTVQSSRGEGSAACGCKVAREAAVLGAAPALSAELKNQRLKPSMELELLGHTAGLGSLRLKDYFKGIEKGEQLYNLWDSRYTNWPCY